jgi:glycosyltransferase involved in cell wall biosynthesis
MAVSELPLVSVLVPVLNEEACITEVIERVRGQTHDNLEVVVADGRSTDRTRDLVEQAVRSDPRVRLIDNPGRIQSVGLNRALAASSGEAIVRLDGHSFIEPDYIERCVRLLARTGAAVVGGRMVARPARGETAQAVAVAMHRRWAAGPAAFHGHGASGPADTVYLGCFRRDRLVAVGGWAEDVGVNEDYELNYRIRQAGGVVYFDDTLEVGYQPRSTLRAVARQYFRYGRSKSMTLRKHPRSIKLRQLAPMMLLPLALTALMPGLVGSAGRAVLLAHAIALAILAMRERGLPLGRRCRLAAVAWSMHASWSLGVWVGWLSGGMRR